MGKRHAAELLADLIAAGQTQPKFIVPQQGRYIRYGRVARTDETEKMEIAGMRCGVTFETADSIRLYVFADATGTRASGPYYTLHPRDVISENEATYDRTIARA